MGIAVSFNNFVINSFYTELHHLSHIERLYHQTRQMTRRQRHHLECGHAQNVHMPIIRFGLNYVIYANRNEPQLQ